MNGNAGVTVKVVQVGEYVGAVNGDVNCGLCAGIADE